MKITNKEIRDDVMEIAKSLSNQDIEIPSLWRCIWPGLVVMLLAFSLGFYVLRDGAGLMYLFISFIFTLSSVQTRGKYLAIPHKTRSNSPLISIIKRKLAIYFSILVISNAFMIWIYKIGVLPGIYLDMFPICSLVILWLSFGSDLSRLDLQGGIILC